ncbi:hypothetical protein RNS17_02540 [Staphylococcus pseudintermedius]|uniref:hypothetical protein n=1 Tax=Staphylococcus pseudintermedius TaxID=283734 RepID=UPI0010F236B7|nr:hypothetical protein [Staphylococcus pseudintermedius]EJJ6375000.1 hypothetical protein [Staphylococcus pseudintermedius]MDT0855452.1 hypothetical protein [Staphylococcus pseudintermedius]VTS43454.1 Uncharacterised protein [Staphylococcus pseudintermedius]HAR6206984.1 hypothetical protein [Staphylococcus pseudintermedius]
MKRKFDQIKDQDDELVVHKIDISHTRLVDLTKLADEAKPFFDWIERRAMNIKKNSKTFDINIMDMDIEEIKRLIESCYYAETENLPLLFDGAGRTYPHKKACYYFFCWIIRDAPQQRLAPLITKMRKTEKGLKKVTAEIDSIANLFIKYRKHAKYFQWESIREVIIDRLEGSRRSISGHLVEANIRAALTIAFQNYFTINLDYGTYDEIKVNSKQIQLENNTIDVSAELIKNTKKDFLFMPVKTRETEGGGHAHLFSRDIIAAVRDIRNIYPKARIALVIIARNWSNNEIRSILNELDMVFHFDMNPNKLNILDEDAQKKINIYVEEVLNGSTQ